MLENGEDQLRIRTRAVNLGAGAGYELLAPSGPSWGVPAVLNMFQGTSGGFGVFVGSLAARLCITIPNLDAHNCDMCFKRNPGLISRRAFRVRHRFAKQSKPVRSERRFEDLSELLPGMEARGRAPLQHPAGMRHRSGVREGVVAHRHAGAEIKRMDRGSIRQGAAALAVYPCRVHHFVDW